MDNFIDFIRISLILRFSQTIREINKMFVQDYSNWQTVNLKEYR